MPEPGSSPAAPLRERLKRLGVAPESAARLWRKALEAKQVLGIHGVSVTAGVPRGQASEANREDIEKVFQVYDTPTRGDRGHRTVELPEPVTTEVAHEFNRLFGRTEQGDGD